MKSIIISLLLINIWVIHCNIFKISELKPIPCSHKWRDSLKICGYSAKTDRVGEIRYLDSMDYTCPTFFWKVMQSSEEKIQDESFDNLVLAINNHIQIESLIQEGEVLHPDQDGVHDFTVKVSRGYMKRNFSVDKYPICLAHIMCPISFEDIEADYFEDDNHGCVQR